MAKADFDLNLSQAFREAMIQGLADLINGLAQYRLAVILRLLRMDPVAAILIAESLGEHILSTKEVEDVLDAKGEEYDEVTWEEMMNFTLDDLEQTPGGRGEVL